jgi:hypothetical protein
MRCNHMCLENDRLNSNFKKKWFNETSNEYYDTEKHQLSCILIYYD